ncbi:MAG: hypothetical protein EZS28_028775 [Streblomastix strix]|uniref:DDE-1 domain-containing protein n=1 Tax=Streblomastix strix TaxID=222440 RepID=A0A5J4UYV2_9EUKA|nr:MAG: hypothetical protein EZS28_028775 [Streblomastix strix]
MPAITLCGGAFPPLVATKILTLNYEVHTTGLFEFEDVLTVHSFKRYVNGSIMFKRVTDSAIQYIENLCSDKLRAHKEAILLMENLSAHRTDLQK